jgi:hypothetical protein
MRTVCPAENAGSGGRSLRTNQPDWWDPPMPGVGTNRYACANNDPVNLSDPGGNQTFDYGFEDSGRDLMQEFVGGLTSLVNSVSRAQEIELKPAQREGLNTVLESVVPGCDLLNAEEPLDYVLGVAGVIPGAKAPMKGAELLASRARELVSLNSGRARVTLHSSSVKFEVDLTGRPHANVPTPHMKSSPRNLDAPAELGPKYNTSEKFAPVMTLDWATLRTIEKFLGGK